MKFRKGDIINYFDVECKIIYLEKTDSKGEQIYTNNHAVGVVTKNCIGAGHNEPAMPRSFRKREYEHKYWNIDLELCELIKRAQTKTLRLKEELLK